MDPLSVTASVVSITAAALQSARFLAKTIDNVKDAPSTVKDISADLRAVELVLQNLEKALQGGSTQTISDDQINIATSRQGGVMEQMKDMMLQQNEVILRQQITRADNETTELERSLQQITLSGNTKPDKESEQSKKELLEELKRQQDANANLRDMCEEAVSQTVYERTGQKIKGVKATNDSSALAGFINISGEELRINQDISDVTADNRSFAGAGVINNVDFRTYVLATAEVTISAESHRS